MGSTFTQAQSVNCGLDASAGGTLSVTGGPTPLDNLSPDPGRSGESSGLDLIQYVFTNPNDLVTDTLTNTTGGDILFLFARESSYIQ